ncbi:hypothetical protein C8F01DRAFT_1237258 [Mycena amicta]|nr:hypothetical protein C8F01DRAFT_1237258 [Mycena amicta]
MFNSKFNTIVVLTMTTLVVGIDLCAWPSTQACLGFATCCFGVSKNACCGNLAQTVGFSVSYRPLESAVAFGQAWTSSDCGAGPIGTNQVGPGDRCWTGLGITKANSVAWANFGDRRRGGSAGGSGGNFTETVSPNAFVFKNKDGVQKAIRIPDHEQPGAVDALIELYQKGDFAALEGPGYEAIERTEPGPEIISPPDI